MLTLILLPFRILKFVFCAAVLFVGLSPFYFLTMETYHGMKAAHERAVAAQHVLHVARVEPMARPHHRGRR